MVLRFPVEFLSVAPSALTLQRLPEGFFSLSFSFAGWSFTFTAAQHFPHWVGATVGVFAAHFFYLYQISLPLFLLEKCRPSALLCVPSLSWDFFHAGIYSSDFDYKEREKKTLPSLPTVCVVCDPVEPVRRDKPQRENLHTMKPLHQLLNPFLLLLWLLLRNI